MNNLDVRGEFKLEKGQLQQIKENFCSESLSEEETKLVLSETYKNQGILIDPHTAIGVGVAKKNLIRREYYNIIYCTSFKIF